MCLKFPKMPGDKFKPAVYFIVIITIVPLLINVMSNDIYTVLQNHISMLMRLLMCTLALIAFGAVNHFFVEVHYSQDRESNSPPRETDPLVTPLANPSVTERPYRPRSDPEVRNMVGFWNEQRGCEFREYVTIKVQTDEPVPHVEAAFGAPVAYHGSKVLLMRLELGPQIGDHELDELSSAISETMRRAREIDENCTLQLGSFAVMKHRDASLKWWRLQRQWTPTISCISTSWNVWDFITGQSTKWSMSGFNLQNATLKVSTVDESENLNIFKQYQKNSGEDVLLFEEPHLVQREAPSFSKEVYIYALKSMEVEEGVTFDVQSKPKSICKAYWISVVQCLRHTKWKMILIGILIINAIHTRCIGQASTSRSHFEDGDIIVNVGTKFEENSIILLFLHELPFFFSGLMCIILVLKISSILHRLIKVRRAELARELDNIRGPLTTSQTQEFSDKPNPTPLTLQRKSEVIKMAGSTEEQEGEGTGDVHVLGSATAATVSSELRSKDTLPSGDVLRTHETLVSSNGMFTFVNQGDGNLCIYNINTSSATWTSGTSRQGIGNLCLRRDGNLVFYNRDGDVEDPNAQIWSSSCRGKKGTGTYKLIMQGDGNLVVYDANHKPIWTSNTSSSPSSSEKVSPRKMKLPTRDRLHSGDVLRTNEELVSSNGMYKFVNQGDGDLCIYNTQNSTRGWASGTQNQGTGNLYMQKDGSLVLYKTDKDVVDVSAPIWFQKGRPNPGPYKLIMQDNGNLLMYDTNDRPTWGSNGSFKLDGDTDTLASGGVLRPGEELLSNNGMYTFVNQRDGNLCIYLNQNWRCTWATMTNGKGVGNLYLQRDGNLILYNMDGDVVDPSSPLWSSGSRRGTGQYKMIMQDDGNLVIYDADPSRISRRIWAAHHT